MMPARSAASLLALVVALPAVAAEPPREARGVVRALQEAVIAAEYPARIAELRLRPGESFAAGDRLVAFDCARPRAERAAAAARRDKAKAARDAEAELVARKAAGRLSLETAEADLAEAAATVAALDARLSACEIRAPFAGRVVDRRANPLDMADPGKPLLVVAGTGGHEIELIAPSRWLGLVKAGTRIDVTLDETGESVPAIVRRLGAAVDAASQTVRLFAEFERPPAGLVPGMSGTARFQPATN